jgi:hypothetical protein
METHIDWLPSPVQRRRWISRDEALDMLCGGTTLAEREAARLLDAATIDLTDDGDDVGEWCYARFPEPSESDSGPRVNFRRPKLASLADGADSFWIVVEYWRADIERLRETALVPEPVGSTPECWNAPEAAGVAPTVNNAPGTAALSRRATQAEIEEWLRDDYKPNAPNPSKPDAWEKLKKAPAFGGRVPKRDEVLRPAFDEVFGNDFDTKKRGPRGPRSK